MRAAAPGASGRFEPVSARAAPMLAFLLAIQAVAVRERALPRHSRLQTDPHPAQAVPHVVKPPANYLRVHLITSSLAFVVPAPTGRLPRHPQSTSSTRCNYKQPSDIGTRIPSPAAVFVQNMLPRQRSFCANRSRFRTAGATLQQYSAGPPTNCLDALADYLRAGCPQSLVPAPRVPSSDRGQAKSEGRLESICSGDSHARGRRRPVPCK